jgi:glycosyltransferase involved in cell wall biosynthesis
MKQLYFTVTNDLTYDQRMHRICHSLATAGYNVTLVGRELNHSIALEKKAFSQKRLRCFFNTGFIFYAEYNLRLLFYLLFKRMDCICAIDLDTILPCLFISKIKSIRRVYDAHEYFTELKEVKSNRRVQQVWLAIEKFAVPKFKFGYTVSGGLAEQFHKNYQRQYIVIRNMPVAKTLGSGVKKQKVLLYQGAVNEGRGFEYLIPAMQTIPYPLIICGDGNFMEQLKTLITKYNVADKVELKGMLLPAQLWSIAQTATVGIALAEREGLNQLLALPNKFFDYIQAGLPQVAMNYPEYEKVNSQFEVAVLLNELTPDAIANTINQLMENLDLLEKLEQNCMQARKVFCWQNEEVKLISFYKEIFEN